MGQQLEKLVRGKIAAPQLLLEEHGCRKPGDQGAVEIKESTNLWTGGGSLDVFDNVFVNGHADLLI